MILRMDFKLKEPLVLPVNYQYLVQSAIYSLIREEETIGKHLHDQGALYDKRQFRLFVFGRLRGNCTVKRGRIGFWEKVSLEIRSIYPELIEAISNKAEAEGIRLGRTHLEPFRIFISDKHIEEHNIFIEMDSPIVAYRTLEDKKTVFYGPQEEEFYTLVLDNLRRKYKAYSGEDIPEEKLPRLRLLKAVERDKIVTKYKNFYISGWGGLYQLTGEPEYLNFLFQTGIGSKNAQGFGMFQIVEEE